MRLVNMALTEEHLARFWSRVDQSAGVDGCWIWTGARCGKGYGHFCFNGQQKTVHRLALEMKLGRRMKPGMFALHSCDIPSCCNPWHLREDTARANAADMVTRGRHRNAATARYLSAEDVREIQEAYARGESFVAIARRYGISQDRAKNTATNKPVGTRTMRAA